ENWQGKDLTLNLGAVDDQDVTYFNGVKVGSTINDHPEYWSTLRSYKVPGDLVKKGDNLIAVRCFDEAHAGGLMGPEMNLRLTEEEKIDLTGEWKSDFEEIRKPLPWPADYLPLVKIYRVGSVLYNAMFNPLKNYSVRGIIWYQGESNADNAKQYQVLFKDLITAWRSELGEEKLPFMFVQLAAYNAPTNNPNAKTAWAELRRAQEMALELPESYMVPTIDIGDQKNIHPQNKQEVGRRLGLLALKNIFGAKDVKISFPSAVKLSLVAPGKVLVTFDGAEQLQTTDGQAPKCFAVANGERKYEWAVAKIVASNKIELSAPTLKDIVWVRYAWSQYPEVNLVNGEKFPALPFEKSLETDAGKIISTNAGTKR
ncbi:MAG: sialate O-acetylesterase, partial [Victivallaceae bacterium]